MLALLIALAGPAQALEPVLDLRTAATLFPEGFKVDARPGLRQALWNQEGSLLFEDTWVQLDLPTIVTPSYARVGPRVVFAPIAVFEASAQYAFSPYFGTFSSIVGFDDPDTVPDDDALDPQIDAGLRGTGWLHKATVDATLRGKVGPIIAAVSGGLDYWDTHPADKVGGAYFYEPEIDLLLAYRDTTRRLSGAMLYDWRLDDDDDRWIFLGALYSHGSAVESGDGFDRVGPLFVYNFDGGKHQFLALVQAYIEHRVWDDPVPPYLAFQVKRFVKGDK